MSHYKSTRVDMSHGTMSHVRNKGWLPCEMAESCVKVKISDSSCESWGKSEKWIGPSYVMTANLTVLESQSLASPNLESALWTQPTSPLSLSTLHSLVSPCVLFLLSLPQNPCLLTSWTHILPCSAQILVPTAPTLMLSSQGPARPWHWGGSPEGCRWWCMMQVQSWHHKGFLQTIEQVKMKGRAWGYLSRHVQFSFLFFTLFITCTFTVGHITDALLLLHMTHYESSLRSVTYDS